MRKQGRGFAIVISLGILAVLSMIAVNFAYSTLLERHIAGNYLGGIKARYAAEAGIARAAAELKAEALVNFPDYLSEAWNSGYNGTIGSNSYNVTIEDEQRKININNATSRLLENLPGIDSAIAANIINYRTVQSFITVEELKLVSGINAAIYNNIAGLITVTSYVDSHFNRSPININTAPAAVIQAVLEEVSDGVNSISSVEASILAIVIIGDRSSAPFAGWADFNASIDRAIGGTAEAELIKNNCNPNRTKPATFTTEFCFNSCGIYNLQSTGTANSGGVQAVATQKQSIVKVFDIWNQTTRDEFMQPWLNDELEEIDLADGDIVWVSWWDSCPVRSDQSWNSDPYDTIPGSLKLGYWDNFQEYIKVWDSNHINDWTAWYWGTGGLSVGGGWLSTVGGWTQSNLNVFSNCNRWNTGGIDCTISMQAWSNRFYFRRWVNSNSDTNIFLNYDPWNYTGHRMIIESWLGYEYGLYSHVWMGLPIRMTLRLNGNNTVAAAYISEGPIGGDQSIGYSTMSNSGQVVGAYQESVKNVRVIPGKRGSNTWNGRYVSAPLLLGHQVRVGNITGTIAIPATASAASETVTYALCPDGNLDINGDSINEPKLNTGDLTSTPQYVVYLSSNNATLFETAALEDVTITYIDSTSSIYSK